MKNLEAIADRIMAALEEKNLVRDQALSQSRTLIRCCANAIRAVHRAEFDEAARLLEEARARAEEMTGQAREHPDVYFAGYVQDALKEYVEATAVYALIRDAAFPDPDELGVEYAAYLNGLGEAAGELRRHVLDIIRHGQVERGERILQAMEDIYGVLVTVDYPDAITGGLRRTTDMVRGVLERTRGDLTMATRQEELTRKMQRLEERVEGMQGS